MSHKHLCPCGIATCQQLKVVHEELTKHYKELRSVAYSITMNQELADDLLQHFCMRLLTKPHNHNFSSNVGALARVAIKRLYLNTKRNRRIIMSAHTQRDSQVDRAIERGYLHVEPTDEEGFVKTLEAEDITTAMLDSLSTPQEREAFHLLCEGSSGREIAESLGMNLNTVHGLIRRLRQRLLNEFPELYQR